MVNTIEDFKGLQGLPSLIGALRGMVLVKEDLFLAEDIAKRSEVVFTSAGGTLIEEGANDNDLYFVLRGRVEIIVHGREYALLGPGAHFGEFSLADPAALRSATVTALEDTVTAKLSEASFEAVATRHPLLWRNVAQVLSSHLRESNRFLKRPNPRPRLVVCASQHGRPFAQAIAARTADTEREFPQWVTEALSPDEAPSPDDLARVFNDSDLAAIIIAPGEAGSAPEGALSPCRDNLLLHCGLSIGALGRERTIIIQPAELEDDSPARLLGSEPLTYRLDPPDAIRTDLDKICLELRRMIQTLGPR